jgi:hypothetical protein
MGKLSVKQGKGGAVKQSPKRNQTISKKRSADRWTHLHHRALARFFKNHANGKNFIHFPPKEIQAAVMNDPNVSKYFTGNTKKTEIFRGGLARFKKKLFEASHSGKDLLDG